MVENSAPEPKEQFVSSSFVTKSSMKDAIDVFSTKDHRKELQCNGVHRCSVPASCSSGNLKRNPPSPVRGSNAAELSFPPRHRAPGPNLEGRAIPGPSAFPQQPFLFAARIYLCRALALRSCKWRAVKDGKSNGPAMGCVCGFCLTATATSPVSRPRCHSRAA